LLLTEVSEFHGHYAFLDKIMKMWWSMASRDLERSNSWPQYI